MGKYVPDSMDIIGITCIVYSAFDDMIEDAEEDEPFIEYLEGLRKEFTDRLKGELLLALIKENNEAAEEATEEEQKEDD